MRSLLVNENNEESWAKIVFEKELKVGAKEIEVTMKTNDGS